MFKAPQDENTQSKPFQALLVAIQFLSVIPVGKLPAPSEKVVGASLNWYPVVGLLLGALLCSLAHGISILFPSLLAAAIILSIWVALTGALHLDGYGDSADAWMGGLGSKERTLRLLKDPTSGPIAIAAMILLLMLKLFAIEALLKLDQALLLIWPLVFARISTALLFVSTPYARKSGLGSAISEYKQDNLVWLSSVIMMLLAIYFLSWAIIPLLLSCSLVFWYLRSRMMKRLQGCTGDTAGALLEITECTVLLSLVASHSL